MLLPLGHVGLPLGDVRSYWRRVEQDTRLLSDQLDEGVHQVVRHLGEIDALETSTVRKER
jgi:hypothetical protein